MDHSAIFRFHGSLNDFLRKNRKNLPYAYAFAGNPAVKDAIEAQGVPHPEVQFVLVNEKPVPFSCQLQPGDQVNVYPFHAGKAFPEDFIAVNDLGGLLKFVLDVHLGKLAKSLRKLGFDTLYRNDYHDPEIARLAAAQDRIVLTRDVDLLKQKVIRRGYWLRSQHATEQLKEVIRYFDLSGHFRPFTRCLECNGELAPVAKETVLDHLPPNARLYFNEFFQCRNCRKVYWKGSHYDDMQDFIIGLSRKPE